MRMETDIKRSAIKTDLFSGVKRWEKLDTLGDPPVFLECHVDLATLAAEVGRVAPRPTSENSGGRLPYPAETKVCILILKRLHNLSDEQIEYQLMARMSYQRCCGLTHSPRIPDRNRMRMFQNRINLEGATALCDAVQQQLIRHGYIARCSQLIDANLVPPPSSTSRRTTRPSWARRGTGGLWFPATLRQKDLDASWTKKHGKSHHGCKLSINADKRYMLIRKIEMSDAAPHDSQHFDAVLDPANANRAVYADKGYASAEREQALRETRYWDRIQRKGASNHPLPKRQAQRNDTLAKVRSRVEHVFAGIEQMGGKLIRTIGIARAKFGMTLMAAAYNLKRLVYLKEARIAPF